jgi:CRISPR-associated protein Cmr5
MRTRQQAMLMAAFEHVTAARHQANGRQDFVRTYGNLCHRFPILVRTNGLCQALAFIESKAAGEGAVAQAHALFRDHVGANLDVPERTLPSVHAAGIDAVAYLHATRKLLQRAIYYKRFAVSVLGESGGEPE